MKRILVIGASRGIGLETVRLALASGFAVRSLSRSEPALRSPANALDHVRGDARDSDDVATALHGVDAVIQTLGIGSADRFRRVTLFSDATRVLIAAMQAQEISRLISVTGFGAGDSRKAVPWLLRLPFEAVLGRAYDDKGEQERLIKASDLDWTIVRPGILARGDASRPYAVLDDPADWRSGVIARSSVAEFLVGQVEDRTFIHKAPVLVER